MRVVLTVHDDAGSESGGAALRNWLTDVPGLKGRVERETRDAVPADAMGAAVDALVAVLEPGGVAAVFAGALVAWVQSRRGDCTVRVTRPDGTRIVISSRQARTMSPQEAAELAERLAGGPAGGDTPGAPESGE